MDFKLIKDKSELEGTCYFEFLPGRFKDKHWNNTSVFLSEDSMFIIENLFEKNFPDYDHWSFCEINKSEILILLKDLEERKIAIRNSEMLDLKLKMLNDYYSERINKEIHEKRDAAILMIQSFIDWMNSTLKENDTISILGI